MQSVGAEDLTAFPKLLFDERSQPWVHAPETVSEDIVHQRKILLASLAESDFGTVEKRVAMLLQQYPETRDSRTRLAIKYWSTFNADVVAAWNRLNLDVLLDVEKYENIERSARNIQNTLNLWTGISQYGKFRQEKQFKFHQYFAAQQKEESDIRLYLDETGTDGQRNFMAVAGICVINWQQYSRFHAALELWREKLGHPETLHVADINNNNDYSLQLQLLEQLQKYRGGLLFVAHTLQARCMTLKDLESLFFQLVLDTLDKIDFNNCLNEPKALLVVKEAADGFDKIYLPSLKGNLEQALASKFLNRVYLKDVQAIPKGREVMLEAADQIAHALQRRANMSGNHPKNKIAEAVMNVTGFEDSREKGIVFKQW